MSTRIERCLVGVLLVCAQHAFAAGPVAPAKPLDDPAGVKAALAARIGRPVNVLRFNIGEHYIDALVQDAAASDVFDRYQAYPGRAMPEGEPQKAGSVDCKRKIAFADLDPAVGVRLLAQARSIAAANRYKTPENIELGSDIFCKEFGWRAILTPADGSDAMLEITWAVDGAKPKAQRLREEGWEKVDMKSLLAGAAPAAPATPKAEPTKIPGDGRTHDFLAGIDADLARIEAKVGAPLAFKHIGLDASQLSIEIFPPNTKKRVASWIVDSDGSIQLWREDDTIPFDCNKPFFARDIPLDRLPSMIASAPSLIPPMPTAHVKSVRIDRSGICGSPHVYIQVEDERGYGNVEYDARGKLVEAAVQ